VNKFSTYKLSKTTSVSFAQSGLLYFTFTTIVGALTTEFREISFVRSILANVMDDIDKRTNVTVQNKRQFVTETNCDKTSAKC
jgi:hypothetical protein